MAHEGEYPLRVLPALDSEVFLWKLVRIRRSSRAAKE
jgi:hypothetical protein